MPQLSKSRSSRHNLLPYLRSASSKISLTAINSTSSLAALFSSSSNNGSTRSLALFGGGSGTGGRQYSDGDSGKENESPCKSGKSTLRKTPRSKSKGSLMSGKKAGDGTATMSMISGPTLTPESLNIVRTRFTLVPIVNEAEENSVVRNTDTGKTVVAPPNSPIRKF